MITGVIKTHDILIHPFLLIRINGLSGYLKLLGKALSPRKYHYVNSFEIK